MELNSSWLSDANISKIEYNSFLTNFISQINIYFFYINKDNELLYCKKRKINIPNSKIEKNQILYLIKKNTFHHDVKFFPTDIFKFNINLSFENIIDFNNHPENYNFLSHENYHNEINWSPTINKFHPLNSLYIIMKCRSPSTKNNTKKIYITKKKKRRTRRNNRRLA